MASSSKAPEPSQETTSLVKRLAGPSTTKAGLAQDQTAINQIIADASKGSKFYQNEKRKDRELTEKIGRLLRERDEALKGVNFRKVEQSVDEQLFDLEAYRDLSQMIVHVDMDAFFANVELLDHPELAGKPFGVGFGVLTTASYEARKFGVRSGMAGFIAKKLCPELILVKMHVGRYIEMSKRVMDVFRRYDLNMAPAGVDEGYLNITTYCRDHGLSPDDCVAEIRAKVQEETKLTVSAGIAPNKMLAKICSDKNKPNGQFHLPFDRDAILAFTRDLSIRKIPGIGRVHERLLESIGIKTCGDIFTHRVTLSVMDKQFGLTFLLRTYLGIASNEVQPSQREERRSIGCERTFSPLSDKVAILRKLEECAEELEEDMKRSGWTGKTVTVKFKLDTFKVYTRAKTFDRWITKKEEIFNTGKELLQPEWPLTLRLVGFRLSHLKDLREPEPSGSIKRFFEPINVPNKRPKLAHSNAEERSDARPRHDVEEHGDLTSWNELFDQHGGHGEHGVHLDPADEYHEDGQGSGGEGDEGASEEEELYHAPIPRPLSSVQPSLGSEARPRKIPHPRTRPKRDHAGPSSNNQHSALSLEPDPSLGQSCQQCPVCAKTMSTDNQGLNAHIDFCLSRSAIRQAQVEAATYKR